MNNIPSITLAEIEAQLPCGSGLDEVYALAPTDKNERFTLPANLSFEAMFWVVRYLPDFNPLWKAYAKWCAGHVAFLVTDETVLGYLNDTSWNSLKDIEPIETGFNPANRALRESNREPEWAALQKTILYAKKAIELHDPALVDGFNDLVETKLRQAFLTGEV
jgi:hypothetical protein